MNPTPGSQLALFVNYRYRAAHRPARAGTYGGVSDSGQQRLFAYDLATRDRLEGRESELAEGNSDARGIWSDGCS